MFELNYIALYWHFLILLFSFYCIFKSLCELSPIPINFYKYEKLIWNERMNPNLALIYIVFIALYATPFFLNKFIIQNEILLKIGKLLAITGISMLFYIYLDKKIKSKSNSNQRNYKSNSKIDILESEIPLKTNDKMECDTNYENTSISNPDISDKEEEKIGNNVENIENKTYKELKISSLNPKEILKVVTEKNYIKTNILQITDFMNLKEPKCKMIFLKKAKSKLTSKRELLAIANIIFQKQLENMNRKEVCQLLNDYFEFNDVKPLKYGDVESWLNSKKPEYYKTLLSIQSK